MSERTRRRDRLNEEETKTNQIASEGQCLECESATLINTDQGELVCEACGLVIEEAAIDYGPDGVRDTVELIPDVRFESVDAGHIPYLAHPERCAQLIREGRDVDLSNIE